VISCRIAQRPGLAPEPERDQVLEIGLAIDHRESDPASAIVQGRDHRENAREHARQVSDLAMVIVQEHARQVSDLAMAIVQESVRQVSDLAMAIVQERGLLESDRDLEIGPAIDHPERDHPERDHREHDHQEHARRSPDTARVTDPLEFVHLDIVHRAADHQDIVLPVTDHLGPVTCLTTVAAIGDGTRTGIGDGTITVTTGGHGPAPALSLAGGPGVLVHPRFIMTMVKHCTTKVTPFTTTMRWLRQLSSTPIRLKRSLPPFPKRSSQTTSSGCR
jgi:hypothetical protein